MGSLVPPDDLPAPSRLVPQHDLPDDATATSAPEPSLIDQAKALLGSRRAGPPVDHPEPTWGQMGEDSLVSFTHGLSSAEDPVSRAIKAYVLKPEGLAEQEKQYQDFVSREPGAAKTINFMGSMLTPDALVKGAALAPALEAAAPVAAKVISKTPLLNRIPQAVAAFVKRAQQFPSEWSGAAASAADAAPVVAAEGVPVARALEEVAPVPEVAAAPVAPPTPKPRIRIKPEAVPLEPTPAAPEPATPAPAPAPAPLPDNVVPLRPAAPEPTPEPNATQAPNFLRRLAQSTMKPTPEAKYLMDKGVPLTVGQMNPRTAVGQIEEASTSLRHVGPSIKGQRDAAVEGWQNVVLKEALPPGMKALPKGGTVSDRLDAIYKDGFGPAYDAVRHEMVTPAGAAPAFKAAVQDPEVIADDALRARVGKFLDNQLTKLPGGGTQPVRLGDLTGTGSVREAIREASRKAIKAGEFKEAELLDNAERAITGEIEAQLPPKAAKLLRDTDSKYAVYKTVERAVAASGDSPSGFTPSQLTGAIKASMDRGAFARGGGGELRNLSRAGRIVFESVTPPTGARLLTVGPLGEWGTGPAAMVMNQPAFRPDATAVDGLADFIASGGRAAARSAPPPVVAGTPVLQAPVGFGPPAAARTAIGSTPATGPAPQGLGPSTSPFPATDPDPAEHFRRWFTSPVYQSQVKGERP